MNAKVHAPKNLKMGGTIEQAEQCDSQIREGFALPNSQLKKGVYIVNGIREIK